MASSSATDGSTTDDNNDLVLIGTGDRVAKLGFVEIHVYKLEFHVDEHGCRSSLAPYLGMDLDSLLRDSSFYTEFVSGKFQKRFNLTFSRSISKEKLVNGFAAPLKGRCDTSHLPEAQLLLDNLVPPEGVREGDMLSLICHSDGETLTGLYRPTNGGKEQELITLSSGGTGGAWLALQNIYFDDDTDFPTIRISAISDLPNILVTTNASTMNLSEKEIDIAVQEELSHPGRKSWSEFAGRTEGPSGYKFGDFTLGVVTAMGIRKSATKRRNVPSKETSRSNSVETRNQDLQKQLEQLELQNKVLQQTLETKEYCIAKAEKEFPFKTAVTLALAEAVCILFDAAADFQVSSLRRFQVYAIVAIGLGTYNQYGK